MCGCLVKNTKRKSLSGELHPFFFLLHLKIQGEFGLLLSLAGTMLAWQKQVCGAFEVSQSELICPELPECGRDL